MSNQIRKAIILAAGSGTRFHPITKAVPKEMLPVIDKPILHYVVEDILKSGISQIIIVTTPFKEQMIKPYFDLCPELGADISYVHQNGPYGAATPILNCERLVGNESFAVLVGDEVFLGEPARLRQLLDVYEKYSGPIYAVIPTDDQGTRKFGIVEPHSEIESGIFQIKNVLEKPGPDHTSSRLAATGSYLLTPDIFDCIRAAGPDERGEMGLAEATKISIKQRPNYAVLLRGKVFDTGTKTAWLQTNLALAKLRADLEFGQDDMCPGLKS